MSPTKKTYMNEIAERHRAGEDRAAADDDHAGRRSCPMIDRRSRANRRRAGDRLGDVAEQLVRAAREDEPLARLGDVDLHEAHAADRLGRAGR